MKLSPLQIKTLQILKQGGYIQIEERRYWSIHTTLISFYDANGDYIQVDFKPTASTIESLYKRGFIEFVKHKNQAVYHIYKYKT